MTGVNKLKLEYYISIIGSSIALFFYFFPMIFFKSHYGLDLWGISLYWFMYAWILLPIYLCLAIVSRSRQNSNWKYHLKSAAVIILSYLIFFVAVYAGFVVHV